MRKNLSRFNDLNYVHFIIAKTYKNKPYFKDEKCCLILLEELDFYRKKLEFKILGYVIMPDHLHCLIFWDVGENPRLMISKIMLSIKTMTSKRVKRYLFYSDDINYSDKLNDFHEGRSGDVARPTLMEISVDVIRPILADALTVQFAGFKFWQDGFYDFNVYTDKKLKEKFDYIHNNPVKTELCMRSEDYKWSSYCQIIEIEK